MSLYFRSTKSGANQAKVNSVLQREGQVNILQCEPVTVLNYEVSQAMNTTHSQITTLTKSMSSVNRS